jgi:myo-inositol-1(or 4)-monophosphatase
MTTDNREILALAENAARVAGDKLRNSKSTTLSSADKDIKLDADKEAHRVVLEALASSGIPVLSEEDEKHDFSAGEKWVVDPLDGSLNFFRGIPISAVSIALMKDGEPVLGVIYDFNREEMFSGIVGQGAKLNRELIFVSKVNDKGRAVMMTGFPSYTDYSREALDTYLGLVQEFKKVRLLGSAALSLAYVACGRAEAYYEKDIKIWDVAAGLALVRSAGGKFTLSDIDREGRCEVHASNLYQ